MVGLAAAVVVVAVAAAVVVLYSEVLVLTHEQAVYALEHANVFVDALLDAVYHLKQL